MGVPIFNMMTVGILPSPLKKAWYRMRGAKIGKNVSIGILTVINSKKIEIGDGTVIGPLTFINTHSFKLGKRVRIGMMVAIDTGEVEVNDDSVIMEQVVIGAAITSRSKIIIGKRVMVFPFSFLNPSEPIIIEDEAGIGGSNYIFTHGAWQSILDGFPLKFGPVTIKKGAWLPWRVFVLPGVTIGEYATIGAGSVINKDIPDRSLAAGTPAKVLKTGSEYIKNYSWDEKHKMVKDILKEFSEYLNFLGTPAQHKDLGQEVVIEINHKGNKYQFHYSYQVVSMPASKIIVSLKAMEPALIEKMKQENKMWFDIEGKAACYQNDPVWVYVRDFFLRYGIRFNID